MTTDEVAGGRHRSVRMERNSAW